MLTPEKRELLADILDSMKADAMAKADHMPENWDGHELRAYLAEKFAFEISRVMRDKRSARVKSFNNEMKTRNI